MIRYIKGVRRDGRRKGSMIMHNWEKVNNLLYMLRLLEIVDEYHYYEQTIEIINRYMEKYEREDS